MEAEIRAAHADETRFLHGFRTDRTALVGVLERAGHHDVVDVRRVDDAERLAGPRHPNLDVFFRLDERHRRDLSCVNVPELLTDVELTEVQDVDALISLCHPDVVPSKESHHRVVDSNALHDA